MSNDFNVNLNGVKYNEKNLPDEIKLNGKDDVLSIFDSNKDGKLSKKEIKQAILSFLNEEKKVSEQFSDNNISDDEAGIIAKSFQNGKYKIGENIQKLIKNLQSRIGDAINNQISNYYLNNGFNDRKKVEIVVRDTDKTVTSGYLHRSNSLLTSTLGELSCVQRNKENKLEAIHLKVSIEDLKHHGVDLSKVIKCIVLNGEPYFIIEDDGEFKALNKYGEDSSEIFSDVISRLNRIDDENYNRKDEKRDYQIREFLQYLEFSDLEAQARGYDRRKEFGNKTIIKQLNKEGQKVKTVYDKNGNIESIQALNYKSQNYAKEGFQAKVLGLTKEYHDSYGEGLTRYFNKFFNKGEEWFYYKDKDGNHYKWQDNKFVHIK